MPADAKRKNVKIMEVRALTKNVRISPEKARQVSRLIQGKSAVEALAIVELSPRKAARRLLSSATLCVPQWQMLKTTAMSTASC